MRQSVSSWIWWYFKYLHWGHRVGFYSSNGNPKSFLVLHHDNVHYCCCRFLSLPSFLPLCCKMRHFIYQHRIHIYVLCKFCILCCTWILWICYSILDYWHWIDYLFGLRLRQIWDCGLPFWEIFESSNWSSTFELRADNGKLTG